MLSVRPGHRPGQGHPRGPRENLLRCRKTHLTCVDGVRQAAESCGCPKMRASEMSTPASRKNMALVWRRTWGVMCFAPIDGQWGTAASAYFLTSHSTASVLSGVPLRVGKSRSSGPPLRSSIHVRSVVTLWEVSGVQRSRLPLPQQRRCGPPESTTSEHRRRSHRRLVPSGGTRLS